MYSQAEAHLANLDHCGSRSLRRAYLVLVLAAERVGLRGAAREASLEVALRDADGQQPFAISVGRDSLGFDFRRPALDAEADLAGRAAARFAGRVEAVAGTSGDVRIRVTSESDAEDIVEWLFAADVSPEYAEHRSA